MAKQFQTILDNVSRFRLVNSSSFAVDKLSDYEMMIAAHLIHPHDIKVTWQDIAGLEGLIQELKETVILPIQRKELFADSQLSTAPKGTISTIT